jgi:hypothetical protein
MRTENHSCERAPANTQGVAVPRRDGATYDHQRDGQRLQKQHERVLALMLDSKWRTLADIAKETNAPEASVSARLRDLRKPKFGGYKVERRCVGWGLWEYRVVVGQLEMPV